MLALDPPGHDERLLEIELHGDIAFILPSKWRYEKYRRHYLEHEHYITIIDNGAYEGGLQIDLMESIAREIEKAGASEMIVVVLPDKLGDQIGTLVLQKKYAKRFERYQRMFVLQGRGREEALRHYWMIEDIMDSEDMIGLPIWMMREYGLEHRLWLARHIDEHVHFLGLDNPLEAYKAHDIVTSIDTSLPYTLAKHRVLLETKNYRLPRVNEEDHFDDTQVALAGINAVLLKALCHGKY